MLNRREGGVDDHPESSLSLEIPPDWGRLDGVRHEVIEFLSDLGLDRDAQETSGMVASELLENAIKYGGWTAPEDRAYLDVSAGHGEVVIAAVCPLGRDPEHLVRLQDTLAFLAEYDGPFEAYVARMEQIASGETSRDGLGLLRVACEGESSLDYSLDDEQLTIEARHRLAAQMVEA